MKKITLLKGKEKSLQRKHPWLFSGAIYKRDKSLKEGDIVEVYSYDNEFLAIGCWQNETIAIKVLTFEKEEINQEFFIKKINKAIKYRKSLGLFDNKENTMFRLINAEGDGLCGLIADWYEGNIVLQFHSVGMYLNKNFIINALISLLPEIKTIFSKSSSTLGKDKNSKDEFLYNESKENYFIALEDSCKFLIDYKEGQKTGFFLDQASNRKLLSQLAKDKKVLNCFSYTGGFSVVALKGGATFVESVDISQKASDICKKNIEINDFTSKHKMVTEDVLYYLDQIEKNEYDIIVLDPPAFAKHNKDSQKALKGYRNINQKAMQKIKSGGFIFTFSCSQAISSVDFYTMLFSCALLSKRNVRIVRRLPHNFDHPQSIFHPEGEYLKGALLYVE